MLSSQCARRNSRVRLTLLFTILVGLVFSVLINLPMSSHASRGLSATPAGSNGKKLRPEFVPGEALVRYQNETTAKLQETALSVLISQGRSFSVQIERFEGSDLVDGLRLAHVAPEDTLNAIQALREQPGVLYAEPNYIMHADVTPNDPQFGSQYAWPKIGAPTAWNTTTGSSNVVVGVIDEGIDINHQDLAANIWTNPAPGSISGITGDLHGYDFLNNTGNFAAGDHATHVSGTLGAVGNNGIGVVGVNWTVRLMSLKFLGAGGGADSDAIRACSYAKQMRDLWVSTGGAKGANIRVLNNSYGGAGFTQAFLDAINALNQSGILFVAAGGNDSSNTDTSPHFPSSYKAPNVIAVAATDSNDALASFSNFGPQSIGLGAPGVNILSTETNNTYVFESGTSMSSPHVAGSAALLCAANPNLTVQQLKSLLLFNGDPVASLNGKTLTGRRLNVANSFQALAENDVTPPGTVTNFQVNSQSGRSFNLGWTASGDDGAAGQASLYQLSFTDSITGAVLPLTSFAPPASGTAQTMDVKVPYRHRFGTITMREFDNVGNEGTPASVTVSISAADGDPYAPVLGASETLSTGGAHLGLTFDDRYLENYALPFSFPFFGQSFNAVTISTNGNLYFSPPPKRPNGDADDVPSSTVQLNNFKMIAGLWDDLYLGTDQRADADVYVVQPDSNTIIFRWQGVPCNDNGSGCTFGGPVNFEIELRSNGTIKTRYGSGNTSLFPVVGISGGEPDAYVITSLTSETTPINLTNAPTVTFAPTGSAPTVRGSYMLRGDFDGDGKTDLAVWRPSNGLWFIVNSSNGSLRTQGWGATGDIPVPGDYDGDGKTDIAVWRPSNGLWFIINSSDGSQRTVGWGAAGDIPVPGDYDGDGKTDIAVWRPSNGLWFIINSSNGAQRTVGWGATDDIPVPGDYDGDGKTDIAVWRPSNGLWFIINSSNGAQRLVGWGATDDIPVPGDYDGDGKTDIAVWRPSNGLWFIINSSNGVQRLVGWGAAGDIPVPGDFDGDRKSDTSVWRPTNGLWFIINSTDGSQRGQGWGAVNDVPVATPLITR
jgi:subtilisin family serine protease